MLKTLAHYDLEQLLDGEVQSYGRIARIDRRPDFYFLKLRTANLTTDVPLILKKDLLEVPPTLQSTLAFTGKVKKSPDGKSHEITVTKVDFYGPFDPKDLQVKYGMAPALLRSLESQRLLTRQYQSILVLSAKLETLLHEVSRDFGLLHVRAPAITFSDCEGGGEVFHVTTADEKRAAITGGKVEPFFKRQAYLTVSGQVDEETITSRFLCPTYIFGPSFRADPSQTSFHACEFHHYEPEIPFLTLEGLMDLEEQTLQMVTSRLLEDPESCQRLSEKPLARDLADLTKFATVPFARITYTEAVKLLQKSGVEFEVPVVWGVDFTKEHERWLCEKHFQKPTFVYRYPVAFKSFYMLKSPPFEDLEIGQGPLFTCESVDLLVPGVGELCGGSLREHRLDELLKAMAEKGLKPEDYDDYLRLRREGTFPHGGYGLGFDRLVMFITGAPSIKDICAFPRSKGT